MPSVLRLRRLGAMVITGAIAGSTLVAGSSAAIAADVTPGAATTVGSVQTDLENLADTKGDEPLGTYLSDKIAILEAHGQVVDGFSLEIANPDGTVYKVAYGQNQGVIGKYERTITGGGTATDALLDQRSYATPRSGKFDPTDVRLADHPGADLFKAIDNIDYEHRAQLERSDPTHPRDPFTSLGLVGVAAAATPYDGYQNYSDLSFGFLITRSGPGNHNMTLNSWGYWYGGACGCADPGDERDALDAEFDPSDMYMTNVTWVPSGTYTAGPFGWHGIHNIAMTSSTLHAQTGADYQKPDKNSKYNDLYVYLAPKSSSYYGYGFNAYANYIHTWNLAGLGGVTFTAAWGFFGISWSPYLTGNWEKNAWRAVII